MECEGTAMSSELAPALSPALDPPLLLARVMDALVDMEGGDGTLEQARLLTGLRSAMKRTLKEMDSRCESALIGYAEKADGFVVGETRYYVGVKKSTRCKDIREVALRLLQAGGADLLAVCLSSDPFKPSATKQQCEDTADLFEVVEGRELREGKPQRRLLSTRPGMED